MDELIKMKQLVKYRAMIRAHYINHFAWTDYRSLPDEPEAYDFAWSATAEEIARARVAGIADAIEKLNPLHVALQLLTSYEDYADNSSLFWGEECMDK